MSIFDKLFRNTAKEPESIAIGRKLPFAKDLVPGNVVRPELHAEGIDLVIALENLSREEKKAIADAAFDVYVLETALAPMIVFKFGEILKCDFNINLTKMNPEYIPIWLNSDCRTVKIYLLEGSDLTVRAIRLVSIESMPRIKHLCERQLELGMREVDEWITNCQHIYSIPSIIENAQIHELIPAVEYRM